MWGTSVSNVPGSGIGWIVDDDVTGIKTAPANIEELTAALVFFRENRDKLSPLFRNCKSKFDRLFHIDQSTIGTVELYSRLFDAI